MNSMRSKSIFNTGKRTWLRYLLAIVLLALLIVTVPVADIWTALVSSRPIPLALAALTILVARFLGAIRTKILMDHQGLPFSLMSIFQISCASTFYGMLLPGGFSGGIIRWYRLSRPQNGGSEVFAVILAERLVDFLVLALWGLLGLTAEKPDQQAAIVFGGLAVVAGICLFISLAMLLQWETSLVRFLLRYTQRSYWIPAAIREGSRRIGAAIAQFNHLGLRKTVAILSFSFLFHAVASVTFFLMAMALGLNLSLISIVWLRAATILLTAVPLSPSGVGVREFGLIYLLLPFGVPAPQAVAFSFLQYAGLLFVALIGAFMDVWHSCVSRLSSQHKLEIR